MQIDEAVLAPLRDAFGDARKRLFLLGGLRPGWSYDDMARLSRALPKGFFDYSWDVFAKDLVEPEQCGDGPEGSDMLEVVLLLAFLDTVPVLKPGAKWLAIEHQAGGVACTHPVFVAIRLRPDPAIYPALRDIARRRWPSMCGERYDRGDPAEVASLDADLRKLGLSCRHVGHCIEESVYPIDADDAALRRVAIDPPALADLIEGYDAEAERGNLAIIILAANSD